MEPARRKRFVVASLLIVMMLVVIVSIQEYRIPTAITISSAGYDVATQIGFVSAILLLFVFITVIYEYLRRNEDPETSNFPVVTSIMCTLAIQIIFIVSMFFSTVSYFSFSLGPGVAFTTLALVTWIMLFRKQGKPIFETNSG